MNYKGISFPFRIGVRGGAEVSEADPCDVTHINEGIEQLLRTYPFERVMEFHIGSKVPEIMFENINSTTLGILKLHVVEALSSDERISIDTNGVHIVEAKDSTITLYLEYYCKEFNKNYTTTVVLKRGAYVG